MGNIMDSKLNNSPIIVNSPHAKIDNANRKSNKSPKEKKGILSNPWIITIVGGIIVGLILFLVIGGNNIEKNDIKIEIKDSNLDRSPVIVDSPGASVDNSINIEKKPDKIIRSIEIRVDLDSLPKQDSDIGEGTSAGLASILALFSDNNTRYRFITDYQFTVSILKSGYQRLTLNYKPESPDQIIGKEIGFLKNINMFVIDYSKFLKTINLKIDDSKPMVLNWKMYLNGIKVFDVSEQVPASTIINGEALKEIDFSTIENIYNTLSK